jgi:hypothetical protein
MTRRDHLIAFINHVERVHRKPAWIAMLELVDSANHEGSGMSEYEILFNYCLSYFPDDYVMRPLIIDNFGALNEINTSAADMVAIHSW